VHREQIVKWERKPTRCNSYMFIFNNFSTCFGHHYAHLQENKTYVTACGVLRWFCQPHPAEPAQHTTCSNICLVLLKMGIMMPETCWEILKNKHITVASCWFSLSLHNVILPFKHYKLPLAIFTGPVGCHKLHWSDITWRTEKWSDTVPEDGTEWQLRLCIDVPGLTTNDSQPRSKPSH